VFKILLAISVAILKLMIISYCVYRPMLLVGPHCDKHLLIGAFQLTVTNITLQNQTDEKNTLVLLSPAAQQQSLDVPTP